MKMMKSLLTILLSLFLATAMLPVGVFAAGVTLTAILVEDMTLYQYGDGDWVSTQNDDGSDTARAWFRYDIAPKSYTAVFSDGSCVTGTPYEIYQKAGDWVVTDDPQSIDDPWGLGTYTVSFTFGELSGSYLVTIAKAPVASVSAEDVTVRRYVDGYYHPDGRFLYTLEPRITVTFEDGTVVSGGRSDIYAKTGYLPLTSCAQEDGELMLGTHTASVSYLGVEAPFTATVIDVVASVELIRRPTQTVIPYGAYTDLSGGVLRVHFTDGTTEDIATDMSAPSAAFTCETLGLRCIPEITPSRPITVGEQELSIRLFGETVSYGVSVLPIPEALILTVNDDRSLMLAYEYETESLTLDILGFSSEGGSLGSDGMIASCGTLYTTGGMFYATLSKDSSASAVRISLGSAYSDGGVYAASNDVSDTHWFDRHNGLVTYGDYDDDGDADTADVRNILKALASGRSYLDFQQSFTCDTNGNQLLDTVDARTILKDILA